MITREMISQAIDEPVKSRKHNFQGAQQSAYDILDVRGRRLYDNLRTQFGANHGEAFLAAFDKFGFSKVVFLDYPND